MTVTAGRTGGVSTTFDPDQVECETLCELDEWLAGFPVPQRRALRPIVESEVRRRVHRHPRTWSDDGHRWVPIRPGKEPVHRLQVTRAIFGVSHYQFPASVSLAWAVAGVAPEVANDWCRDIAPWQPSCGDEEDVDRFDALDRARAWQYHLAPHTLDPLRPWVLDPGVLVRAADIVSSQSQLLRDPGSLQAYLDAGFTLTAARSWHRILSRRSLIDAGQATLPTALAWRTAGVDLPALQRWTKTRLARTQESRYPISWQAALLHVGCPDLPTALPWLQLVRHQQRFTLRDAVEHYPSTPIDWVRAWA